MNLLIFGLVIYLFQPKFALAQVVINEHLPSPSDGPEFIEFYNPDPVNIDITKYYYSDDKGKLELLTGVVGAETNHPYIETTNFLNNDGDTVHLYSPEKEPLDSHLYKKTEVKKGYSFSRIPDGTGEFVLTDQVTKGLSNLAPEPTPTSPPVTTSVPTNTSEPTNTPKPTNTPHPTPTPIPVYNPEVSISSVPSNLKQSQLFTAAFLAKSLKPNTDYYVKLYGGKGSNNFGIETKSASLYLNYTSAWEKFPVYRSDNNGQINKAVIGRIKPEGELGEYIVRIKLKEASSNTTAESPPRAIKISLLLDTTPTPSIDLSPSPTSFEEEDEASQSALLEFDQDYSDIDVLGTSETTPAVETGIKSFNFNPNTIPIIFMVGGGLMLTIPPAINKFSKKNDPPSSESETIEE